MYETIKRSFVKTIFWRIVALTITIIFSYFISKNIVLSLTIGLGDSTIKMISYYLYERIWSRIQWGYSLDKK